MGYDENDDFDAYDILFQQGYDGEMIEVEENEKKKEMWLWNK